MSLGRLPASECYISLTYRMALGALARRCLSLVHRTMFKRHKLEKEEGKAYNEPGVSLFMLSRNASLFNRPHVLQVSEQMRKLNKSFAQLHGLSSLANLTAFFALTFHGLYIGNIGTGIKSIF